jgi:hypothetical protein
MATETKMKVIKKPDGYWVTRIPDCEPCGPYTTKVDAEDTQRGLERFYKYQDEPGFITCEDKRLKHGR